MDDSVLLGLGTCYAAPEADYVVPCVPEQNRSKILSMRGRASWGSCLFSGVRVCGPRLCSDSGLVSFHTVPKTL